MLCGISKCLLLQAWTSGKTRQHLNNRKEKKNSISPELGFQKSSHPLWSGEWIYILLKKKSPEKVMPKNCMEGLFFCSRSSCSHVFCQISERAQARAKHDFPEYNG
ncbi:hypothetical protein CEXT_15381 [Caerostris extrusa]|uniref:Uncharacterized protein n=1 Tax=Caerostris extrusa TaxID=172846 RepID=A0AAV4VCD0_CAEEX|nr:hypothetical protein CEXT_15381 [Caerostris extrusa]